ncbi:hypothetical protein T484DRAFT_1616262 [Baffinella frigidus]|nr:hypothetical protein T484DRAFT_1616262 [Cryptophyta sp. CCMP2293]
MLSKNPDLIVSVHPLCQVRATKAFSGSDPQTSNQVVTDLAEGHPFWFHPGVDCCFIPQEGMAETARECGLVDAQLHVCGLPIRQGFWDLGGQSEEARVATQREIRERLELDQDLLTVLVVGGGDGLGGLDAITGALAEQFTADQTRRQILVVCGHNHEAVKAIGKRSFGEWADVRVFGHVSNMDDLMQAADALVTKAGPGTIAEASACGLPVLLSGFLPGQEEKNVSHVEENEMGEFHPDPRTLAARVSQWLQDPSLLRTLSLNSRRAGNHSQCIWAPERALSHSIWAKRFGEILVGVAYI